MTEEPESADEAAEAFVALREEVAALREAVQALPDTAPTLAVMARALAAIDGHPALKMTPQAHAQQLRAVQEAARIAGEQAFNHAIRRVEVAAGRLDGALDQARTADRQNWRLVQVGAAAAIGGAVLWAALSGPVARALPASWAVPEKMAAATLALDRWRAGERIMQTENPTSWAALVETVEFAKANAPALTACKAAVAKTGKLQHCILKIAPPPKAGDRRA